MKSTLLAALALTASTTSAFAANRYDVPPANPPHTPGAAAYDVPPANPPHTPGAAVYDVPPANPPHALQAR
jgi:hypothetical protein